MRAIFRFMSTCAGQNVLHAVVALPEHLHQLTELCRKHGNAVAVLDTVGRFAIRIAQQYNCDNGRCAQFVRLALRNGNSASSFIFRSRSSLAFIVTPP